MNESVKSTGTAASRKAAIVACSNALPESGKEQIEKLTDFFK